MDHIGIDVHKRESQIYILAEGGARRRRALMLPILKFFGITANAVARLPE